jgi:hypothetical protein
LSHGGKDKELGLTDEMGKDVPAAVLTNSTTTHLHIDSPFVEPLNIIMGRPTEHNTVIAFIAMGDGTLSYFLSSSGYSIDTDKWRVSWIHYDPDGPSWMGLLFMVVESVR